MFRKLLALAAATLLSTSALAAVYPTSNPTYVPSAFQAAAVAPNVMGLQNISTVAASVAGTFTGLTGSFQVSRDPVGTASPTWLNVGAMPVGAGTVGQGIMTTVTTAGVYRLRTAGFAQLRFNQTALSTGSYVVGFTGTMDNAVNDVSTIRRSTYVAVINALAPAASATDFFTLSGSATTTVRVMSVNCAGTSTGNGATPVNAVVRSTADTTGTSTSLAATQFDSLDAAATAVVKAYTVNPGALGTLVGTAVATGVMETTIATVTSTPSNLTFDFDKGPSAEEVTLRGVASTFALNALAASFPSGSSLTCAIKWSEE